MKGGGRRFGFGEKDKAEKADPMPIEILKKQLASTTTEMNELIEALNNVMWLRNDWKHFIIYNFLLGIIRGLGMALGSTVIFALILYFISQLVELNLPLISEWLSMFIDMVEQKRGIVQ